MRPLEFGVSVDPAWDPERARALARLADDLGIDLVGIQDHPYSPRQLDTWMLMAALLEATERVRVFPNVANLPLRPPAVLAKAAATLDVLSGGRFELGLGAGAFWEGIGAMGGPVRQAGESVDALAEAVDVVRLVWRGGRGLSYEGRYYMLAGLDVEVVPAHPIGIWLGALKPRMLALTGRVADGWIVSTRYVPPEQVPAMRARIDESADAAGRAPEDVRRAYNVMGSLGAGDVSRWVEDLSRYAAELGFDTFVVWAGDDELAQLERFAGEVAPAVRHNMR